MRQDGAAGPGSGPIDNCSFFTVSLRFLYEFFIFSFENHVIIHVVINWGRGGL